MQLAKKAVEKERDSLDVSYFVMLTMSVHVDWYIESLALGVLQQRRFQLEHDKKTLEDQLKNAKEESLRSRIQDAEVYEKLVYIANSIEYKVCMVSKVINCSVIVGISLIPRPS